MEQQVNLVTLGVGDLAASRRFYTEGLGWSPEFEVEGEVTFYQVGHGLLLGLFGADDLAIDATRPLTKGNTFSLAYIVQERAKVDEAVARVRAAGGDVLKEPVVGAFGGYHAYIADPDGYLWEIATNPGFTVDDDGKTHIGPFDAEEV